MSIEDWNEDSILSRAGYKADGSISEVRRHVVLSNIIAKYDTATHIEAIRHFRALIECRGDRYPKACRIWQADLQYFCKMMNAG